MQRTVEAYICHDFGCDFYGEPMKLIISGFLRPQHDFKGDMSELISAITDDVSFGQECLENAQHKALSTDPFFES